MNTDLIDIPVSTKDYAIYDVVQLPKIFLGLRVKNKFDEQRLQIKKHYNPMLLSHFRMTNQLEPMFLYGIELKSKPRYKSLMQRLNANQIFKFYDTSEAQTKAYMDVLSEYNLTCDNCYRYLSDGMYPIDIECLDGLSRKNFVKEIQSGFKTMIKKNDNPWYLNLINFNIFVLSYSTGYSADYNLDI